MCRWGGVVDIEEDVAANTISVRHRAIVSRIDPAIYDVLVQAGFRDKVEPRVPLPKVMEEVMSGGVVIFYISMV